MDHIKKIRMKMFKKSSAASKSRRDPKLRYSRSMPLRNSSDTDESYVQPRPACRGDHPLRATAIQDDPEYFPEDIHNYESDPHDEEDSYGDVTYTKSSYVPFIDRKLVDKFPAPPSTTPNVLPKQTISKPVRPSTRPPSLQIDQFDFIDDILPECDPKVKAKMDAIFAAEKAELNLKRQAEARRQALQQTQNGVLQRSISSVSAYTRMPTNHSTLSTAPHRSQPTRMKPTHHVTQSAVPTQQGNSGIYGNPSASCSTRSLGPNARFYAAMANSQNHTVSNSISTPTAGAAIYNNTPATRSNHALGLNARYQAATASPDLAHEDDTINTEESPTTVRRRNASSASSRSALSARRHAARGGPTPPPHNTGAPEPYTPPKLNPYHPDVMRVIRGPHGAKLQCPTPVRPTRVDLVLQVNDTNEREWGTNSSTGARYHPATIVGHGRSAHVVYR